MMDDGFIPDQESDGFTPDAEPTTAKATETDGFVEDKPKDSNFFEGIRNFYLDTQKKMEEMFAARHQEEQAQEQKAIEEDQNPATWSSSRFRKEAPKPQTPQEQAAFDLILSKKKDHEKSILEQLDPTQKADNKDLLPSAPVNIPEAIIHTLKNMPLIDGQSIAQMQLMNRVLYDVFERPAGGLRAVAKEAPMPEGVKKTVDTFVKGFLNPENYAPGTFAAALQDAANSPSAPDFLKPLAHPVISGALGALADLGYYVGVPEAMGRIVTSGKVSLLKDAIQTLNDKAAVAGVDRHVIIPEELYQQTAKNKDVFEVADFYARAKNLKIEVAPKIEGKTTTTAEPSVRPEIKIEGPKAPDGFVEEVTPPKPPEETAKDFNVPIEAITNLDKTIHIDQAKELHNEADQIVQADPELKATFPGGIEEVIGSVPSSTLRLASEEGFGDFLGTLRGGGDTSGARELPGVHGVEDTEPVPTEKGTTLESAIIPGAKQFIEQDVTPFLTNTKATFTETAKMLVNLLDPTVGVNKTALDEVMSMKGTRDKLQFKLEAQTKEIENAFAKMKQAEQVAFIDNFKTGKPQATPDLQAVADMMRDIDTKNWQEAQKYKPSLAWKENHFRVLWKTIPGSPEAQGFKGVFKRPLQGSKGFMKQATLDDMSEGLAMGGVPHSYNPMTLFKMAYADMNKFITAQKMFARMKEMGFAQFVKKGSDVPAGFTKLNDSIAKVYFPAELNFTKPGEAAPASMSHPDEETPLAEGVKPSSYQVPHEIGEWYVDEGVGRILNNFLSKDYIRSVAAGRGLLWIKNNTTAIELSLSPFHAVFESFESVGSSVGLGLNKLYNRGLLKMDPKAALSGLKDILTAPISPVTTARLGGKAIQMMSREDFLDTDAGKHFMSKYPEAKAYIEDLFAGGGKLSMAEDYKIKSIKTLEENLANNNYIGASLRALPALNQLMLKPLFETYIPRLKVGTFLREYPNNLEVYEKDIASGKMTRGSVARYTWRSVENRFGEMNFDNLFWDNNFKTAMQLMFRSVTWKLGSLSEYGSAIGGQAKEFIDAAKEKRAPRLHPSMAWVFGVTAITVGLAAIIQKVLGGKDLEDAKDALFPRVDKAGSRVSMPTYWRDIFHLWHSPGGYIKSGLTGELGRIVDIWQNKDFYNEEVHSEFDPAYLKVWKDAVHLVPLPFSISSYKSVKQAGGSKTAQVLGFLGFTKAPGYINRTPTQEKIFDLYQKRFGDSGSIPKDEFQKRQARSKIKSVVQASQTARTNGDVNLANEKMREAKGLIQDAIKAGQLSPKGLHTFEANARLAPDVRAFKRLPASDQIALIREMSGEEKKSYFRFASKDAKRSVLNKKATVDEGAV